MAAIRVATAVFLFAAVSVAGAATAASITVMANGAQFLPGETIELTITTDSEGSLSIATAIMATQFDTTVLNLAGPGQNTQSMPDFYLAHLQDLDAPPTSEANGIQYSLKGAGFGFVPDPGTAISGITRLIVDDAALPGFTTIDFGDAGPNDPFTFGNATAPASVMIEIVPEPTTALLLAAGLVGLGVCRRH